MAKIEKKDIYFILTILALLGLLIGSLLGSSKNIDNLSTCKKELKNFQDQKKDILIVYNSAEQYPFDLGVQYATT